MWIKRISVNGFGKLKDKEFKLSKGLNLIYGNNESGKTSLTYMLLNMLGEPGEELAKYEPWYHGAFGGLIEWDGGKVEADFRQGRFQPPCRRNILEAVGFLLEDERLEARLEVDGTVVANLKKKMEETDIGRTLCQLIEQLKATELEVPKAIDSVRRTRWDLDEKIQKIHADVVRCNATYQKKQALMRDLEQQRAVLSQLQADYEKQLNEHIGSIRQQLSVLNDQLVGAKLKKEKHSWIREKPAESIDKIRFLADECNKAKRVVDGIREKIATVTSECQRTQSELEKELELLKIDQADDLDKVYGKIQQADLLNELKAKSKAPEEAEEESNRLWLFFSQNEDILERIDEADDTVGDQSQLKQRIENTRKKQKDIEVRVMFYKWFCLASAGLATMSLAASFFLPLIANWLYAAATAFAVSALAAGGLWARLKNEEESLYDEVLVDYREVEDTSSLWDVLNELGISDVRQLRKAFIDYVNWCGRRQSNEDRRAQIVEIQQQLAAVLEPFGLGAEMPDATQQIAFLKACLGRAQTLAADFKRLDDQLRTLQNEERVKIEQRDRLESDFAGLARELNLNIDEAKAFHYALENYSQAELQIARLGDKIDSLEKSLADSKLPEQLGMVNHRIKASQEEVEKLSRLVDEIADQSRAQEQQVDREALRSLLMLRDSYLRKIKTLKAVMERLPGLEETLQEYLADYVERYSKRFKDQFAHIYSTITGRDMNVVVQNHLSIKLTVEGRLADPRDAIGSAAFDQMLFAFKVALQRTLPEYDLPFVIDNAFIRYDDDRLNKVMQLVLQEAQERQIIILTSDNRLKSFGQFLPIVG